jgi:hypothetical protein
MATDAEKALREVHEACPCRFRSTQYAPCPDPSHRDILCGCQADTARVGPEEAVEPCVWPGHVAIDRAVRAAYLAGRGRGLTDARLEPSWLPAEKERT